MEGRVTRVDLNRLIGIRNTLRLVRERIERAEDEIWKGMWGDEEIRSYLKEACDSVQDAEATITTLLAELKEREALKSLY